MILTSQPRKQSLSLVLIWKAYAMSTLPTVIVFGGTGPTGESIVNGLSESKAFVCLLTPSC